MSVLRAVVEALADVDRPVLLAIDGGDGAGKTRFADALAVALADELAGTRPVVRAGIDDFLHPRAHRHAHGRTAETVWARSHDLRALRRELLDPWRAGPGAHYRRAWWSLAEDRPAAGEPAAVPERGVLVFDGIFAQRPELADCWDLVVWLDVPEEERVRRLAARDGLPGDPDHPDQRRYLDAQARYREEYDPRASADLVVDNTDWADPRLHRVEPLPAWRGEGTHWVRTVRVPEARADLTALIDALTGPADIQP